LFGGVDALGDGFGHGDGGSGVALEGEESFADGDFDFLLTPRYNLVVATDDAEGGLSGGLAVDGNFAGAVKQEALGDEVGVIIDEGFFDELVEGVEREAEGILATGELGEVGGDLAAEAHDPGAVGVGEDVFIAFGEGDVCKGFAEGVGDFGEDEALFAVRAQEYNRRYGDVFASDDVAPSVVGLLVVRGVNGALEGEVVR
jgi:hypothetical protein